MAVASVAGLSAAVVAGVPSPVGAWDFDDPENLLKATLGQDLGLTGQHQSVAGVRSGDGAVRIGVGSYYRCAHGIAPVSPAAWVNRFSLLYDLRVPSVGPWYSLYQTDPDNANDGDCFIRSATGTVGVGTTGYSTQPVTAGAWQRLVIAADHGAGIYRIYLNGVRILEAGGQAIDGRFALEPTVLFFADEDGEDAALDVTRLAIYDICLTDAEVAELGAVPTGDPANQPPRMLAGPAGPTTATTGQTLAYRFAAEDPEGGLVQVQIDWGDGSDLSSWSDLAASGTAIEATHVYRAPGLWEVRALARDAGGGASGWTAIQSVTVSGTPQVAFVTRPFLQNVKPGGITLMWEMDGAADVPVDYGLDTDYGSTAASARQASGAGTYIYKCVLTGLAPGTRYVFRCRAGAVEETGTFATAAAGDADFSFAVWSDSQGSNHGTYAADPFEPTRSMMRHMADNGIAVAVTTGDLAESGDSYTDTRQYYLERVAAYLGRAVPWFVAWGNHDAGSSSMIRRFADLPSQERAGFTAGYGSYSFDYAGCHFVCLDYASATSDIYNWLEGDLKSPANQQARFTFLFVHVPPYCELWVDGNAFYREALVPLMEAYGVDVCFSGHTHEYSRGYLNGVHYCITGGGSWLDTPEVLVHDWPHMTVGGYHAIPGVVKPGPERGGGLINEYVRVDVKGGAFTASMIGFEPDGTAVGVLDQFSNSPIPVSNPPLTPLVSGPAQADVLAGDALVLNCSDFSDPDAGDSHRESVWRLCRIPDVTDAAGVVLQGITAGGVLQWSAPVASLMPGQTLYASVRHMASDGGASAFATPIVIRLLPDPIYHEDFESVAELSLPPGWVAHHRTAANHATQDPEDPLSNVYLTWTVVSRERLARVFGANRVNVAEAVQGQSVYAESDQRQGVQIQYLTSPDINLSGVSNVVLTFRSNYMQNQDSLGAVECSTDAGATWKPVVYLLDRSDVMYEGDGTTVDGLATFTRVDDSGVPKADGRSATGGTYGAHILARPFADLGDFVSPRIDDDAIGSKRLERFRVTAADQQPAVRFRFTLVGTASWFWGIDDFSLFGSPVDATPLRVVRATVDTDGLELEWTGPAGPYQLQSRSSVDGGSWADIGDPLPATQRTVRLPLSGPTGYYRLRLSP